MSIPRPWRSFPRFSRRSKIPGRPLRKLALRKAAALGGRTKVEALVAQIESGARSSVARFELRTQTRSGSRSSPLASASSPAWTWSKAKATASRLWTTSAASGLTLRRVPTIRSGFSSACRASSSKSMATSVRKACSISQRAANACESSSMKSCGRSRAMP